MDLRFFPGVYLYKCLEFSVHGTIYIVCQNMIAGILVWTRFFFPDVCLQVYRV